MSLALSADSITLSFPQAKAYHGVARLVVGGLAARLELSYEHLEDLQLALESVLDGEGYVRGDRVIVQLVVESDSVVMEIGPLDPAALGPDLEPASKDEISLSRLLATLVEEVSLRETDDGHRLRMVKRVPMTRPEPRKNV
ncbi:MAG: ATP-binding protein [Gaiellaceae bacterium]